VRAGLKGERGFDDANLIEMWGLGFGVWGLGFGVEWGLGAGARVAYQQPQQDCRNEEGAGGRAVNGDVIQRQHAATKETLGVYGFVSLSVRGLYPTCPNRRT